MCLCALSSFGNRWWTVLPARYDFVWP